MAQKAAPKVPRKMCRIHRLAPHLVSPALADAMMPALESRESVRVDLPWSTWAITDMLRMLFFLSMIPRIWSTVKFTCKEKKKRAFQVFVLWGSSDCLFGYAIDSKSVAGTFTDPCGS